MNEVTIRDLRRRTAGVLTRVEHGETVIVTRAGVAVGELRPLPRPCVTAEALLLRWRHLPLAHPDGLRADVDEALDATL